MSEKETSSITIKQKSDLLNYDISKYINIIVKDLHCTYLNEIPVHIQILTINNCGLTNLSQICCLDKLKCLEVSGNRIADISEIVYNLQLVHFDVSNNFVIKIEPVLALKKLKTLIIAGNMIKNLEPLVHHENFTSAWIQPQNEFTEMNVYNTLTPGSSEENVKEFIKNENQKHEQNEYIMKFIKELAPLVKNEHLEIKNNTKLKSLRFIDYLGINTLNIENCPNINFEYLPTKVKHLTITKSGLTSIDGLAKMTWLESLDVSDNLLLKCQPISNLKLLKKVVLSGNQIIDLKHVYDLPQLDWTQSIMEQNPIDITDYQKLSNADELLNIDKLNAQSNKNIIYDSQMARKYHSQVQNGELTIVNDYELTSIYFSQLIGVDSLYILRSVLIFPFSVVQQKYQRNQQLPAATYEISMGYKK
ncbi:Conserved_hypothetical protein [Hexamita inflata]|uniref:Uncharacterized protein n=1 Tax=Hexamita inflata TaxID=28002 RepID=A0AA86VEK7_9EUKA|nr:Conserved hypothetical protein [Hexamita inflata]